MLVKKVVYNKLNHNLDIRPLIGNKNNNSIILMDIIYNQVNILEDLNIKKEETQKLYELLNEI